MLPYLLSALLSVTPVINSGFGWRTWIDGSREHHNGVDIACAHGEPIRAMLSGIVSYAGWAENGWGYMVLIDSGRYRVYYAHNSQVLVKVGKPVRQGQTIALCGSTGRSTGSHSHVEVRDIRTGAILNPSGVLPGL